jgi:hypothetical protein
MPSAAARRSSDLPHALTVRATPATPKASKAPGIKSVNTHSHHRDHAGAPSSGPMPTAPVSRNPAKPSPAATSAA